MKTDQQLPGVKTSQQYIYIYNNYMIYRPDVHCRKINGNLWRLCIESSTIPAVFIFCGSKRRSHSQCFISNEPEQAAKKCVIVLLQTALFIIVRFSTWSPIQWLSFWYCKYWMSGHTFLWKMKTASGTYTNTWTSKCKRTASSFICFLRFQQMLCCVLTFSGNRNPSFSCWRV